MRGALIGAATITTAIGVAGTAVGAAPGRSVRTAAPPAVDDATIELAMAGLAMFAIDNMTLLGEPTAETACPIMSQEGAAGLLGAQGLASRPDGYVVGIDSDDVMAPLVYCGIDVSLAVDAPDPAGGYGYEIQAAFIDDPALFAEWAGELGAAVAPADASLGGDYAGRCADGDGVEMCFAAWHRNGLVIRQVVAGPQTGTLQAQSDAILLAAVPAGVAGLAGYVDAQLAAPEGTLPPVEVPQVVTVPLAAAPTTTAAGTDGDRAGAARVALLRFALADITVGNDGVCPIVPQQRIDELAVAAGFMPRTDGYLVGTDASGYTGTSVVTCGVPPGDALATPDPAAPHALWLEATFLDGIGTLEALYGGLGIAVTTPDVAGTGGDLATGCQANPDDPATTACVMVWHRDGLVITLYVVGPVADVTAEHSESLLLSLLPEAEANLTAMPLAPPPADEATTAAIAAAAANADAALISAWYRPEAIDGLITTFVTDSPAHFSARYFVDSMVEAGDVATPNASTPYTFTVESVTMIDAGIADVTACVVDSTVVSDSSGAVINDAVGAARLNYTIVEVDGRWLLWQLDYLEVTERATTCPDAPPTTVSIPPTTLAAAGT